MASIFNIVDEKHISILQNEHSSHDFKNTEYIFKEGQRPFGIFIITRGKVKISKTGYDGREQIIRFASDGNIIGYRSLLGNENYTCTATAISDSHLCFIPREAMFNLMAVTPQLSFSFMKLLAGDIRDSERKIMHMAQRTVRERVAESILILKEVYGYEEDNATIDISLKREEIAAIAGTVRETATRLLYEFRDEEFIQLVGKKIKILNLNKIVKCANLVD